MAEQNGAFAARFLAALVRPDLTRRLALLACVLVLPSVLIGFHLDDYVHRYMLSQRPGAAELLRVYESPYGIANGERADNQWQMEHGYAPWWTHPDLLVSLWRPLSELSHRFDAALFPDAAVPQHLHSIAWFALLVVLVTRFYRALLGPTTVSGMAALMYALDHAHGFAVGWIANRNALIAAALGAAALHAYVRARALQSWAATLLSAALLGLALLAGESSVAVLGFVIGHALFVERSPRARRVLAVLPHLLVVVGWRLAYVALGRGARHSGLYIDPLGEPWVFAAAALERVPVLVLGQLGLPPAETIMFAPEALRPALLALAVAFCALLLFAFVPLLRRDEHARMLALGTFGALLLACSTHPHDRLLFYVGLGAMPLLSRAWHEVMARASAGKTVSTLARGTCAALVGFRLVLSPLLLPLMACSVALTAPAESGARSVLGGAAGRDTVIVASPDYFYVKLVPVLAALEGRQAPSHLLALSFGAVPVEVTRLDERTLKLNWVGKSPLGSPLLELYRARGEPLDPPVELHLADIEADDDRELGARFRFRRSLDDPQLALLTWDGARFVRFLPPAVGAHVRVPGAALRFGL